MYKINVIEISPSNFRVSVTDTTTSTHDVTVQTDYALELTKGKVSTAELVKKSFEFLLAREPNTSILRSFDLSVIGRYFPEYENIVSK